MRALQGGCFPLAGGLFGVVLRKHTPPFAFLLWARSLAHTHTQP